MAGSVSRRLMVGIITGSVVFGSTGAVAAATPPGAQANPWAVLSAMSGGAAATAVCGAAAAATAAQPATGCVLPRVDMVPAAEPGSPPPPVYLGTSTPPIPVLLVWAGVLATMIYIATLHHHHHHHANSPA
jgi:hypothetical protein